MKVKELFEERDDKFIDSLDEEVLTEGQLKISELLKKPANELTKSEKNRLFKFRTNLNRRETENFPKHPRTADSYKNHYKKYNAARKKVSDKLSGMDQPVGSRYYG